jgi:hypothetical protein
MENKVKILVTELPDKPSECPFAIFNNSLKSNQFPPPICKLKYNWESNGIIFGKGKYYNCTLHEKGKCDQLVHLISEETPKGDLMLL